MERFTIDTDGPDLARKVSDAWKSITLANDAKAPHPAVMLRGDKLVRLSQDEQRVKLELYNDHSLTELLSVTASCTKTVKAGTVEIEPPMKLATYLRSRQPGDLPGALRVDRVTDVPVFGPRPDGTATVVSEPGYHADSRTYYAPAHGLGDKSLFSFEEWSDDAPLEEEYGLTQQQADVKWAKAQLGTELLSEFPWANGASKTHALCMILEPFARALFSKHEPTPMYAVTAHQPRTGKTCLVQSCLSVPCGVVSASAYTGDADELRKRLTAVVMEGRPVVWFDNVSGMMDSAPLAAALTSPQWSDRILGTSAMADVPIRNLWVMTANNPSLSAELTRRVIPIQLESPRALDHRWKHSLPTWAFENRPTLVRAALILVANYIHGDYEGEDESGPLRSRPYIQDVIATYPSWSRVMGGILAAADITHFLGNLDAFSASVNVGEGELSEFIEALAKRLNGRTVTRDELATIVDGQGESGIPGVGTPIPLPLELTAGNYKTTSERLGYRLLRPYRGAVVGGFKVVCHEGRPTRWSFESTAKEKS